MMMICSIFEITSNKELILCPGFYPMTIIGVKYGLV
jgi:hypothetical protein